MAVCAPDKDAGPGGGALRCSGVQGVARWLVRRSIIEHVSFWPPSCDLCGNPIDQQISFLLRQFAFYEFNLAN